MASDDHDFAVQQDLLDEEKDQIHGEEDPNRFNFALTLKIQGTEGLTSPITLAVGAGRAPGNRVEEYLYRVMASERFRRILRSIVGEPLAFSEKATLPGSSSWQPTGEKKEKKKLRAVG